KFIIKRGVFVLDSIDSKIIRRLSEYGRSTWAELGTLLNLSAPAAADRVRRLEERGVIKGYTALINPEAAGYGLMAFITVALSTPEHRPAFLAWLEQTPEIVECHHIAGEGDYLLKVRCPKIQDLERLISLQLKSLPGINGTRTTIVLSTCKETGRLPLNEE
ncbi:MAG TPA: Lrp/AsnC family transcriptional regulator, partial [Patescibacteria group bacterium]|nr:Lrp/AsnC family transcriptional regulator [Patescibacteria group bacterium]